MATIDPPDVRSHDDHLLRRFVAARTAGDPVQMNRWWGELLTVRMDWLRLTVRREADGRLSHHELEDAVQRTAVRVARNLQRNFRGTTIGEWANAVRTAAHFACVDVQQDAIRDRHDNASLDAGDGTAYASFEAKREAREAADAEAVAAAEERLAERLAAMEALLPRLSERRRIVVEHDRRGASTEELKAALGGATRDTVYKTRERAYTELHNLMRTDES